MVESLVADKLTVVGPVSLYTALQRAWLDTQPDPCSRASLLLLVGHFAFETGWGHACHNFNLGNIKHVKGDGHDYCGFAHDEVVAGKTVWVDENLPPGAQPKDPFIAYATLDDGVHDYFRRLRAEFRTAWPYVLTADASGFAHALKVRGYYTGPEGAYARGVASCMMAAGNIIPDDAALAAAEQSANVQAAQLGLATAIVDQVTSEPSDAG